MLKTVAFTRRVDFCAKDTHTLTGFADGWRGNEARPWRVHVPQQMDSLGGRQARPVRSKRGERARGKRWPVVLWERAWRGQTDKARAIKVACCRMCARKRVAVQTRVDGGRADL